MPKSRNFRKKYGAVGLRRSDTGIYGLYFRRPVPKKLLYGSLENKNGECKVTVPADPEKLAAYRASKGGSDVPN